MSQPPCCKQCCHSARILLAVCKELEADKRWLQHVGFLLGEEGMGNGTAHHVTVMEARRAMGLQVFPGGCVSLEITEKTVKGGGDLQKNHGKQSHRLLVDFS